MNTSEHNDTHATGIIKHHIETWWAGIRGLHKKNIYLQQKEACLHLLHVNAFISLLIVIILLQHHLALSYTFDMVGAISYCKASLIALHKHIKRCTFDIKFTGSLILYCKPSLIIVRSVIERFHCTWVILPQWLRRLGYITLT